jgi:glycosyltransferase involved in cell wall biosynthesis
MIGDELFGAGFAGASRLGASSLDPGILPRMLRHLKPYAPHVLFALDHHNALFWGGIAGRILKVPVTIAASHTTGRFGGKRNFTPVDKLILPLWHKVVALSETHARYLKEVEGISEEKLAIVPNGIDVKRFAGLEESSLERARSEFSGKMGDKNVFMISALRPEKAHEILLQAAATLTGKHPGMRFFIVGDGPRRREIEKMVGEMGLGRYVTMLGHRDDIPVLLGLADALVLPSHDVVETLPLVVLEAMAARVPVVASAVGSVPEVVKNGDTGFLVPPGDIDCLERAIESATGIGPPGCPAIESMLDRAESLVREKYTSEKMLGKYMELFRGLYESKTRRGA